MSKTEKLGVGIREKKIIKNLWTSERAAVSKTVLSYGEVFGVSAECWMAPWTRKSQFHKD